MTRLSKEEAISALLGSWTFTKEMSASHYYHVKSFVVLHFLRDPNQIFGCTQRHCDELNNRLCQHANGNQDGKDQCLYTDSDIVEWSEVSAMIQFGWQVSNGYYWQSTIVQNTTDWFGPYNLVLAQNKTTIDENSINATHSTYVSRYVQTPATSYLRYPQGCSVITQDSFGAYGGLPAVQSSIEQQLSMSLHGVDHYDDPYQNFTCPSKKKNHHDDGNNNNNNEGTTWTPLLPRFELFRNTTNATTDIQWKLEYELMAFPDLKDPLYKEWPALLKHFSSDHDIRGPYCWNPPSSSNTAASTEATTTTTTQTTMMRNLKSVESSSVFDSPVHGYSIPLFYDSSAVSSSQRSNGWKLTRGCLPPPYPCYGRQMRNDTIPSNDDDDATNPNDPSTGTIIWQAIMAYGCYFLLVALILSLTCNCQLSWKLRQLKRRYRDDIMEDYNYTIIDEEGMMAPEDNELPPPLVTNNDPPPASSSMLGSLLPAPSETPTRSTTKATSGRSTSE